MAPHDEGLGALPREVEQLPESGRQLVGWRGRASCRHRVYFCQKCLERGYGFVQICTFFLAGGLEHLELAAHLGHLGHFTVDEVGGHGWSDVSAHLDVDLRGIHKISDCVATHEVGCTASLGQATWSVGPAVSFKRLGVRVFEGELRKLGLL